MLTRWMQATAVAALVLGLAVVLAGSPVVTAQIATPHGQNIAPAFEGWQENEDGSFNLLFGYFNRNWAEELHIPIGPDNNCLLYTSPSPRDRTRSRMPSSA